MAHPISNNTGPARTDNAETAEPAKPDSPKFKDAATILQEMAETFRERNKVYGDNYLRVGAVISALFPAGVVLRTEEDFNRWHLFELVIVKLTRFTNSGLLHKDSIHDASVYGAMLESLIDDKSSPIG